jgi:pimeloyl-ACP methyl ester carboxylesterase
MNPETDTDIRPFRIDIPQSDLDDLRARLERTRSPGPETAEGWSQGPPLKDLHELVTYWSEQYDWRAQEAELNRYPQFTTTIDGQTIHFLHVRSSDPDALPLILTHGWPGTFVEYLGVIEHLTDAFDLVIPSIPGFAFSSPTEGRWGSRRIAAAWAELMQRLGYERYGVVGNDAGAIIAPHLGRLDADHVVGVHVTQVFSFPSGDPSEFEGLTEEDYRRLGLLQRFMDDHSAFNKVQSTRPQTLAYGLADSPVGQLAWNLDLLRGYGEQSAGVQASLDRDWILTNVMLYWLTNTAGSSARIYYEDTQATGEDPTDERAPVPLGVAVFPEDFQSIRTFAERDHGPIAHWSELGRGGHFAGTDAPDLLAADVRTFFGGLR